MGGLDLGITSSYLSWYVCELTHLLGSAWGSSRYGVGASQLIAAVFPGDGLFRPLLEGGQGERSSHLALYTAHLTV